MAVRPVFIAMNTPPYRTVWNAEFVYNKGLAVSQKQKNITAVHNVFRTHFSTQNVLEISSKSLQDGGISLSAFHLLKYVPSIGKSIPVENIYQGGKVFKNGGPYTDLYHCSPREAKGDERLQNSGALTGFYFEGQEYPLKPLTAFYNYIYISALRENPELAKIALAYDAFTDIEFNPNRSLNCQAEAAALFVSLTRMDLIDRINSFDEFLHILLPSQKSPVHTVPSTTAPMQTPKAVPSLKIGDIVIHKLWGKGIVAAVNDTVATVSFESVGEKKLGIAWILQNCEQS